MQKIILLVLFSTMLCAGVFADNVKYDSRERGWTADKYYAKSASNSNGAEFVNWQFAYTVDNCASVLCIDLLGSEKSPWVSDLEGKMNFNDMTLNNQSVKVTFSNGKYISTNQAIITSNQMAAGLFMMMALAGVEDKIARITVYLTPNTFTENGGKKNIDFNRFNTLIRSYNIKSVTVNGHTSNYSGLSTAIDINASITEIISNIGHDRGLGSLLRDGDVRPKTLNELAEDGDVPAQKELAARLMSQKKTAQAMEWYRKAANGGDAESAKIVGRAYFTGINLQKDYSNARRYLEKASDDESKLMLARCYFHGLGGEKDEAKGMILYQGLASDFAEARFRVAVNQNNNSAMGYEELLSTMQSALNSGYSAPVDEGWLKKGGSANFAVVRFEASDGASLYVNNRACGTEARRAMRYGDHCELLQKKDRHYDRATQYSCSPSARGNVTCELEALQPITGKLSVNTDQTGAVVFIGNDKIGTVPLAEYSLMIGDYELTIQKTHYRTIKQKIKIEENKSTAINETMVNVANLTVTANRSDATLYVNDKNYGIAPVTMEIPVGNYTFEGRNNTNYIGRRQIRVTDQVENVHVKLKYYYVDNSLHFGADYTVLGAQMPNITVGLCPKGFSFDLSYGYGLTKSNEMNWYKIPESGGENQPAYNCCYRPQQLDVAIGTRLHLGRCISVSPQLDISYLWAKECNGETLTTQSSNPCKTASNLSVGPRLRISCGIVRGLELVVTPEYMFPVIQSDGFKKMAEFDGDFKKWGEGLHLRVGLNFLIY